MAAPPAPPAELHGDLSGDRAELERALLAELGPECSAGLRQLARDAAGDWASAEWYRSRAEACQRDVQLGKAEDFLRLAAQYSEKARETWGLVLDVQKEAAKRAASAPPPDAPDPLAWLADRGED